MTRVLLILLIVAPEIAFSQGYSFRVLAAKGNIELKSGGEWVPLKIGQSLNKSDVIKLGEQSYLGLLHSEGWALEWRTPGTITVSELEYKRTPSLKRPPYLPNRGPAAIWKHQDYDIKLISPNQVKMFGSSAIFRWHPKEEKIKTYVVEVMNMYDDVLLREETRSNYYELDLTNPELVTQRVLLFSVSNSKNEDMMSRTITLLRMEDEKRSILAAGLAKEQLNTQDDSAENHYKLAIFFEENQQVLDAITHLEKALLVEPRNTIYKNSYQDFLNKHQLNIQDY